MISCRIKELKDFMGKLLTSECFDSFLLREASIVTCNTFHIDGRIQKDFFSREEWEDTALHPFPLSLWKDMRPLCFSLIKGRRTPVSLKFVLHLMEPAAQQMIADSHEDIQPGLVDSFVLTIRYDGSQTSCTTGVALSVFSLDKSADALWDKTFFKFLDNKGISWEAL